jgi:hypothetical protein
MISGFVGLLLLGGAFLAVLRWKWMKVGTFLALGGGLAVGNSGWISHMISYATGWLSKAVSGVSSHAFGMSVGAHAISVALVIFAAVETFQALRKRGGVNVHQRFHPLLAFALPALALDAGGFFARAASTGAGAIGQTGGSLAGFFG